jgi:hypothetical protein
MARIVDHQIQLPKPMALLAFEKSETEERRRARSNPRLRRKPFGRRRRKRQHPARFRRLLDEQLALVREKKEQSDRNHYLLILAVAHALLRAAFTLV